MTSQQTMVNWAKDNVYYINGLIWMECMEHSVSILLWPM